MLLEERLREPCECFLSSGHDLVSDVWWCAPGSVWMIVFLSSHLWSERQVTDMTQSSIQLHFCSSALLLPLAVSYCSHFHFSTHLKPVFSRRTFITYIDPKTKHQASFLVTNVTLESQCVWISWSSVDVWSWHGRLCIFTVIGMTLSEMQMWLWCLIC